MRLNYAGVFALALLLPQASYSEDKPPEHFYKLDFVAQELDGSKVVNSREYSLACSGACETHANSEVHVTITNGTTSQYQSFNIGFSVDCRNLHEINGDLALYVNSGLVGLPPDSDPKIPPVVRKQNWSGVALVRPRKQTVIFSSDDFTTKHKLQLVLTATPIQ